MHRHTHAVATTCDPALGLLAQRACWDTIPILTHGEHPLSRTIPWTRRPAAPWPGSSRPAGIVHEPLGLGGLAWHRTTDLMVIDNGSRYIR